MQFRFPRSSSTNELLKKLHFFLILDKMHKHLNYKWLRTQIRQQNQLTFKEV